MTTSELWQAVLGELELSLSKANFTTWFKQTFIHSCEGSNIVIGVPNLFTKAWLEKKYQKEIFQSLQNLTNGEVKAVHYNVVMRPGSSHEISFGAALEPRIQETEEGSTRSGNTFMASPAQTATAEDYRTPPPAWAPTTTPSGSDELSLNAKYTFENFIVGKQNELAHAASQAVAAQPGGTYNPLYIYGGVGLGKTHLLQAVGNELIRKNPSARVLYVTCERFTNDFIQAVRGGHAKEFKNRYRNVDLLLVDDIQFMTGKEGTQEEFFHTFNQLYQDNKQIVISSDRPPKAIPALENRLVSRFECGMMTDVGSPDFETRVAILETKCREKNFPLVSEILHHIATTIQINVRELEGALNKIIAFHQFKNMAPTIETVRPMLASFQPTSVKKTVTARQLIQVVASHFDVPHEELLGKSREKRLAFPRQIVMYLMREEMRASYPSIGTELGGRDHTTAMHAYDKISGCLINDEKLQHDLELIRQRVYA